MYRRSAKQAYREFLDSNFWKKLSREKKKSVGNRCERCGGSKRLQAHHRHYLDDWHETTLDDLIILCRVCHATEHGLNPFTDMSDEQLRREHAIFLIEDLHNWHCAFRLFRPSQLRCLRILGTLFPDDGGILYQLKRLQENEQWLKDHPNEIKVA